MQSWPFKSWDFKEAVDIRSVLFKHCSLWGIHSTIVLYSLRSKGQQFLSKHIPCGLIIMKLLIWNTMPELYTIQDAVKISCECSLLWKKCCSGKRCFIYSNPVYRGEGRAAAHFESQYFYCSMYFSFSYIAALMLKIDEHHRKNKNALIYYLHISHLWNLEIPLLKTIWDIFTLSKIPENKNVWAFWNILQRRCHSWRFINHPQSVEVVGNCIRHKCPYKQDW